MTNTAHTTKQPLIVAIDAETAQSIVRITKYLLSTHRGWEETEKPRNHISSHARRTARWLEGRASSDVQQTLDELLLQIESLQGESSSIDEDILQGEAYLTACKLIGRTPVSAAKPRDTITSTWSIEDVQQERPDLTDDQAREVLRRVEKCHDATIGINWDVLNTVAGILFPAPAETEE